MYLLKWFLMKEYNYEWFVSEILKNQRENKPLKVSEEAKNIIFQILEKIQGSRLVKVGIKDTFIWALNFEMFKKKLNLIISFL